MAVRTYRQVVLHDLIATLSRTPDLTVRGLTDALGVSMASVRRALDQLESDGVVVGSPPPGERAGKFVKYRVDADRVRTLLRVLEKHLLDEQ